MAAIDALGVSIDSLASGGDIASGDILPIVRAGQVLGATWATPPLNHGIIGLQVFSTPGTFVYTPTVGTSSILLWMTGAGGGGGWAQATGAGQFAVGKSGAPGQYGEFFVTQRFKGAAVQVGQGGAGGSSALHPNGATGGSSGLIIPNSDTLVVGSPGGAAGLATNFTSPQLGFQTGSQTFNILSNGFNSTGWGAAAFVLNADWIFQYPIPFSPFTPQGPAQSAQGSGVSLAGLAGGVGQGGTGGIAAESAAAQAGGAGGPGQVVIWEFG